MCKSVYTYLTICFPFEKPRSLLRNTTDRAGRPSEQEKYNVAVLLLFIISEGATWKKCYANISQDVTQFSEVHVELETQESQRFQ